MMLMGMKRDRSANTSSVRKNTPQCTPLPTESSRDTAARPRGEQGEECGRPPLPKPSSPPPPSSLQHQANHTRAGESQAAQCGGTGSPNAIPGIARPHTYDSLMHPQPLAASPSLERGGFSPDPSQYPPAQKGSRQQPPPKPPRMPQQPSPRGRRCVCCLSPPSLQREECRSSPWLFA